MKPVEEFVASHHLIQRRHPPLKKVPGHARRVAFLFNAPGKERICVGHEGAKN
jgi:hypothetical protein